MKHITFCTIEGKARADLALRYAYRGNKAALGMVAYLQAAVDQRLTLARVAA